MTLLGKVLSTPRFRKVIRKLGDALRVKCNVRMRQCLRKLLPDLPLSCKWGTLDPFYQQVKLFCPVIPKEAAIHCPCCCLLCFLGREGERRIKEKKKKVFHFHFLGCLDSVICSGFLNPMLNCVFYYCLLHQGLTSVQCSTKLEHDNKNKTSLLWKWQKSRITVFPYNGRYVSGRNISILSMITSYQWEVSDFRLLIPFFHMQSCY